MSKKNTRKRLLAGALSAIMMLTMCPTWALADDDGIATLPLVDESRPVADFAPVVADPIETPDVPSSSEPEVQEPANEAPSAGQDIEESGNNSNDPASDASEDNSQNNNAADSSPDVNDQPQDAANDVSPFKGGNNGRPVVDPDTVQTISAEFWLTNRHAVGEDGKDSMTIDKNTVGDGIAVTKLAPANRTATADEKHETVFWQARVLSRNEKQTTASGCDRTSDGTEIEAIRYADNKLQYREKDSTSWTDFSLDDQLVFYYLIRTGYSQMVQIDVSDWTVTKEPTEYDHRRGVNYKVIVDGGADNGTVLYDKTFWYNSPLTVSSVRVRQTEAANYTINRVELDPVKLGEVSNKDDEFQFSLGLSETDRIATVNIYVSAKKYNLSYDADEGTITSDDNTYTVGEVYPDIEIIVPTAEREGYTFDGWFDEKDKKYETGDLMPGNDLTLTAKWTAKETPKPEPEPEPTTTPAKYFVLLPNCGTPASGASQGKSNYLPNDTSDGGVEGKNTQSGYTGALTEAGVTAAGANTGDDTTNGIYNVNGVDSSYLVLPEDLGFFDKKNWTDGIYNDTSADTSILGENFNPNAFEIVWYTIKNQGDGYHVDGYVKNVAIDVTYHSNFGDDKIYNHGTKTGTNYEALGYADTELPTRDGYVFGGWYKDAACNTPYETSVLMTGLHLYAKWVKNVFDVTYFDDNNVQYGDTESYETGTSVTVRTDAPTKEGYTFTGWANIAKIVTVSDGKFTMPAENVRFDAQFTINKYTVTWKNEGNTLGTEEVDYKNKPTKTDSFNPTKDSDAKYDYEFTGWKREDGDDTFVNPNDIEVTADVTYVAVFTPVAREYTVTYKVDGGIYTINDAKQVFTYHYGDKVQLLKNASKEGHTFSGWSSKDVTFNGTGTGFTMPAENVVIEGTFTAVPAAKHRVNYYVDGVYYAYEEYETGANVTIKADLAKVGYTFSGWKIGNDDAADFTMPDNDVDIHGSYSQNKHSYTINKHFYDEKGAEIAELASTATASGAENALIADLYKADAVNQTVNEKNYVYVSAKTTVEPALNKLTENVTINLHYYLDVKGGKTDPDNKGDDIPDAWEYRLTFKVVNGEWNNGGSADIVVYVPFKDKDGKELDSVIVPATSIPAVGEKPAEGFVAGAWDKTPVGGDKVAADTVFTYTYAKKTDPTTPDDSGNNGSSSGGHSHRRNPTVIIPDEVPTGLNGDDHYAYIVGYPDATVRPQNGITRAEVATIFFRLLDDETREANSTKSNSYSDVASGAWYNHAISTLSAMGIVKGDTKGKFNPNASITRAEFAAIAARFDDNANTSAASFSDIANHWAKDEISAAANNGWITGYTDGTFRPNNRITRAEAMTLVNRVLKRLPETDEDLHEDMITWSDNSDASQWYYLDVQEATNSHYYDVKENQYEKWTDLRETRDWTELEK